MARVCCMSVHSSKKKSTKKRSNPNRLIFRGQRDRRAIIASAAVLFARYNRELSALQAVRGVVIHKGASVAKQGIKRDYCMGLGLSYDRVQRLDIGEFAHSELNSYSAERVAAGPSHANGPASWLAQPPLPVSRPSRPREEDSHEDKENATPNIGLNTRRASAAAPARKKTALSERRHSEPAGPPEPSLPGSRSSALLTCIALKFHLYDMHIFDFAEVLQDCYKLGFSWTIIADNIDIMTRVKMMSKDNKNKFYHFFHVIASLSRIPVTGRDDVASGDMKNYTFLGAVPSQEELAWMSQEAFAMKLGQQVQPRLTFMTSMQHCVVTHINHQYFAESCKKSHEVCLFCA